MCTAQQTDHTGILSPSYPIVDELEYKLTDRQKPGGTGHGWTTTLSSRVITFVPDVPLPLAKGIELSIAWPVLLDGKVVLRLWIQGSIRESNISGVTVEVLRYEFRTKGLKVPENSTSAEVRRVKPSAVNAPAVSRGAGRW